MKGSRNAAASPRGGAARLGATAAERALWKAARAGEVADVSAMSEASRRVSPGFIRRLLTEEAVQIAPAGVRLRGAWLDGPLNLKRIGAAQPFAPALALLECTEAGAAGIVLDLEQAGLLALDLSGSRVACLHAPQLQLAGELRLEDLRFGAFRSSEGGFPSIILSGAKVGGPFELSGTAAEMSPELAGNLWMDVACVAGRVSIRNIALNRLILGGADFGERLTIGPGAALGHATAEPQMALMADGLRTRGDVFIEGPHTRIEGETQLRGAEIGGGLSVRAGVALLRPDGDALRANRATIKGGVFIAGPDTRFDGATQLLGAEIGGQLSVGAGVALLRPDGDALRADGATIKGDVFIEGPDTRIEGATQLLGAEIGGSLGVLGGAVLRRPEGRALNAGRAVIKGGLFLRHREPGSLPGRACTLHGRLSLVEARINGVADLRGLALNLISETEQGPPWLSPGKIAIEASGLRLDGDLRLGEAPSSARRYGSATLNGAILLARAEITGALVLTGARIEPSRLEHDAEIAVDLEGARLGARLECHGLPPETRGIIDLRGAHTAFLDDRGGRGWGQPCGHDQPEKIDNRLNGVQLRLDGFTYDRLPDFEGADGPANGPSARADREAVVNDRLAFLFRQFPGSQPGRHDYAPHSFEQAAKVLRALGHPQEAESIARAKREFRTRCRVDNWYVRGLQHFLDWGFGHFYSPLRAIRTLCLALVAGLALLLLGDGAGAFVKKVNDVALPQHQVAALAPALRGATPPRPPREACWLPPKQHRIAWTAVTVAQAGLLALDILLPLVDLRQEQRCEPDADSAILGQGFGVLLTLYSLLGVVIIPLFVATVSGLAQRD